jgi:hypothetical protein
MHNIIVYSDIAMARHFLLFAKARTLPSKPSTRLARRGLRDLLPDALAETDGAPVCPRCGCLDAYSITTRRKFNCKACLHQFSVTSGTIFASCKMAFVDLLAAICLFVNGAKGMRVVTIWGSAMRKHGTRHCFCY